MNGKLLVATDGASGAAAALRIARSLSERRGASVEVVAVVETLATPTTELGNGMAFWTPELLQAEEAAVLSTIRAQLAEVGGAAPEWTVTMRVGSPAPEIVRVAAERGATMILIGFGRHSRAGRWLWGSTTERVVHLSHVPVLAVPADATPRLRRAVAAIDFSDFSLDAARGVADLLAPGGEIHLLHVVWAPRAEGAIGLGEWDRTYRAGAATRLARIAQRLEEEAEVSVRFHVAAGETAEQILIVADRLGADVIAAGSHGYGFLGRIALGSVSGRILRAARFPVLIAPPEGVPSEITSTPTSERTPAGPEIPASVTSALVAAEAEPPPTPMA